MGVHQLWSILEPVRTRQDLSALRNKTLCVDLSGWICEARCAKGLKENVNKPHLRNLFFRVLHLTRLGVKLVFVVDGKAPELKWDVITKRIQARNGGHVSKSKNPKHARVGRSHFAVWVKECCLFLNLLGFPCIESAGEAEATCAWLDYQKIVDGCITNDGDAFLYGARTVYKDLCIGGKDASVECYRMEEIETQLNLNREKLVAMGILLGCDYLPQGVPGVGKEITMKLMKEIDSDDLIDRFYAWTKGTVPEENLSSMEKLVKCKALKDKNFPHPKVIQEFLAPNIITQKVSLKFSSPHLEGLQEFCLKHLDWPEEYTRDKVLLLTTYWQMTSLLQHHKALLVQPERIVKARIQQKIECYEVEWQNIKVGGSCPSQFVTIETRELFARVYPEVVEEFNNVEALKCKKRSQKKKSPPSNDHEDEVELLSQQLKELKVVKSSETPSSSESEEPSQSAEVSSDDDSLQEIINTVLPTHSNDGFLLSQESLTCSSAPMELASRYTAGESNHCYADNDNDDDECCGDNDYDDNESCQESVASVVKTVLVDPVLHDVFDSSDEDDMYTYNSFNDNDDYYDKRLPKSRQSSLASKAKAALCNADIIDVPELDDIGDNHKGSFKSPLKLKQNSELPEVKTDLCDDKLNGVLRSRGDDTHCNHGVGKNTLTLKYSSELSGMTAVHHDQDLDDVFGSSDDDDDDYGKDDDVNDNDDDSRDCGLASNGSLESLCSSTPLKATSVVNKETKLRSSSGELLGNARKILGAKQERSNSDFSSQSTLAGSQNIQKCQDSNLNSINLTQDKLHKHHSMKENLQVDSPGNDYLPAPLFKRLGQQLSGRQRLASLQSISSIVDD